MNREGIIEHYEKIISHSTKIIELCKGFDSNVPYKVSWEPDGKFIENPEHLIGIFVSFNTESARFLVISIRGRISTDCSKNRRRAWGSLGGGYIDISSKGITSIKYHDLIKAQISVIKESDLPLCLGDDYQGPVLESILKGKKRVKWE